MYKCMIKSLTNTLSKCVSKHTMEEEALILLMPEEVLLHVARFLPFRDVVNLSVTCHRMKYVMKYVLPKFRLDVQEIKGPDLIEEGAYTGDWDPLHYFDTPRLTSFEHWKFDSVWKLTISMKWKDQVDKLIHQTFS